MRIRLASACAALMLLALFLAPGAFAQGSTVSDLRAQAAGTVLTLTWTHGDTTWVSYEVWRTNSPYAPAGDPSMVKLGTRAAGAKGAKLSFDVTSSGVGSVSTNRFYAVRGVSGTGGLSPFSNRAGEFDFSLRGDHQGITQYDGPQTCIACHASEAEDALHSEHMKWDGKWQQVNTYCTSPAPADYACLSCHASTGKVTNQTVNDVDCLVCHNDTYQRSLQPLDIPLTVTDWQGNQKTYMTPSKNTEGYYTMQPRFDLMPPGTTMAQLAQNVHMPTRATCLRCHAKSGGGDGVKRGDISTANLNPSLASDVHMSPQGGDFTCQTCHAMRDHQIPGRGIDLHVAEGGTVKACTECHGTNPPHINAKINDHTGRVACQSCHIPTFAKDVPTEMSRDWRTPVWNPTGCNGQGAWVGEEVKAGNVVPQYTFWNGTSEVYNLPDPISPQPDGTFAMAAANGDINGGGSKLYPIKLHESWQPRHDTTGSMVQYDVLWNFMTGKYEEAAARGVAFMGLSGAYSWVHTTAEQLITHGVEPKENALLCDECHVDGPQVDLPGLGYALKGPESQVCTQCHGQEDVPSFYSLHRKHVDDKGYDCSRCHTFTRANG